jgi:hypothetical protein
MPIILHNKVTFSSYTTFVDIQGEFLHTNAPLCTNFMVLCQLVGLIKMCLNETCSKVHKDKYLSDKFPIQNGLKRRTCFIAIYFQLCFRICC